MSEALDIAQKYFDLSNKSDFEEIEKLFIDSTTYSSETTGIFLGVEQIIEMQKPFHGKFSKLNWHVNSVEEVKPGIVLFDYTFTATTVEGDSLVADGLEYVIVLDGKIQHIEIRSKK